MPNRHVSTVMYFIVLKSKGEQSTCFVTLQIVWRKALHASWRRLSGEIVEGLAWQVPPLLIGIFAARFEQMAATPGRPRPYYK